jgi:outer membrane protein
VIGRFQARVWSAGASLAVMLSASPGLAAQAPPERLSLKDAEQRAVDGHPQVQAGLSAARAANEVVREVKSAYWPMVYGSLTGAMAQDGTRITAGGLNNPSVFDRVGTGVTVSQLVTDFGRTGSLAETQQLRADAQNANATRLRAEVLLRLDQAYFDALRAQAVLRVARQTVEARQLVVDQVTALAASNLKSGLDVSFARVNLSQAQLLLVQAQSDVNASFAALGAAMGSRTPAATYDLIDEPIPSPPSDDAAPLIAQAFRERPDLSAQRLADQAAAKFVSAEHALWYPTVAAVGVAGVTPYHGDSLNDHYVAAGVNVNVPIANGNLYSARRAEAAYRAEVEDQALRDLENQVTRDVTLAWLQAKTGYQRVDLTNQLLAQASDALELAQARYNLGLSSIVELTQAQLNKTQAEIDQATSRYDYQARTAALRFQTGLLK